MLVGSTLDNINNSEHTIIKFQVDNKLCFATINQFFKDYKNKSKFPFSLWITVETRDQNENGHPTDTEATMFNNTEDSLIAQLLPRTPICYIGRTTRDGYREIMIYVADKDKTIEIVDSLISHGHFPRKVAYTIDPDPTWTNVEGFY